MNVVVIQRWIWSMDFQVLQVFILQCMKQGKHKVVSASIIPEALQLEEPRHDCSDFGLMGRGQFSGRPIKIKKTAWKSISVNALRLC